MAWVRKQQNSEELVQGLQAEFKKVIWPDKNTCKTDHGSRFSFYIIGGIDFGNRCNPKIWN